MSDHPRPGDESQSEQPYGQPDGSQARAANRGGDGAAGDSPTDLPEAGHDRRLGENVNELVNEQGVLRSQGNDQAAAELQRPSDYFSRLISPERPSNEAEEATGQITGSNDDGVSQPSDLAAADPDQRPQPSDEFIAGNRDEAAPQSTIDAGFDEHRLGPADGWLEAADPPDVDSRVLASEADEVRPLENRYVVQFHVEGPLGPIDHHESDGPPTQPYDQGHWVDLDGVRSDTFWTPIGDLLSDTETGKTWEDLCREMDAPEEVAALYDREHPVKDWLTIADEHSLPEAWGFRSLVSVGRLPDEVSVSPDPQQDDAVIVRTVAPVTAIRSDGTIEQTAGGGRELVFNNTGFDRNWVVSTSEIGERVHILEREMVGMKPLERLAHLMSRLPNTALEVDRATGQYVPQDQRYLSDGKLPVFNADGTLAGIDLQDPPDGTLSGRVIESPATPGSKEYLVFTDESGRVHPAAKPLWKTR